MDLFHARQTNSFICYVALVRGTVGMVFVTVEILAEDQIVLEQLARCALHPVLDAVRPAGGVASIELRLGEGREHAGEQPKDMCGARTPPVALPSSSRVMTNMVSRRAPSMYRPAGGGVPSSHRLMFRKAARQKGRASTGV